MNTQSEAMTASATSTAQEQARDYLKIHELQAQLIGPTQHICTIIRSLLASLEEKEKELIAVINAKDVVIQTPQMPESEVIQYLQKMIQEQNVRLGQSERKYREAYVALRDTERELEDVQRSHKQVLRDAECMAESVLDNEVFDCPAKAIARKYRRAE